MAHYCGNSVLPISLLIFYMYTVLVVVLIVAGLPSCTIDLHP